MRIKQKGELNSQYGTCWINKLGIEKKIKLSDKNIYLNDNWNLGRKNLCTVVSNSVTSLNI